MATPPPTETPAPLRSLTADEIASIERRLEYENIGKAWVRGLLATLAAANARIAELGQLLAHVHLHLTNDENFDAEEFEADLRKLDGGKWIDTESLLINARARIAEVEAERDEARSDYSHTAACLVGAEQALATALQRAESLERQHEIHVAALQDIGRGVEADQATIARLAAEIGRMAAVVEAATMLRHSGYDSRTMLFAVMCEAVDRYAALSSPAPEGTENG